MNFYECFICHKTFLSMSNILKHLKFVHKIRESPTGNETLKCVRSCRCDSKFSNFKSMQNHSRLCDVSNIHFVNEQAEDLNNAFEYNIGNNLEIDRNIENVQVDDNTYEEISDEETDRERNPWNGRPVVSFETIYTSIHGIVTLFLNCMVSLKIPKKYMSMIMNQLEIFVTSMLELMIQFLSINVYDYQNSEVSELITLFFANVLHIIKTSSSIYLINRELHSNPSYVAPIPKNIGARWDFGFNRRRGRNEELFKLCDFYYVPLKETLNVLFRNQEFRRTFFHQDHICENNVFRKFCCGRNYKDSIFYRNNPKCIRLQLYYDDFNLTDNRNNDTTKMGGVYFHIENMPKMLNSHIDNIYLLALFNTNDLKNFGQNFNTILYPIVEELEEVRNEGLQVENMIIKCNICSHAGDNLAIHTAFGMFESFNATYFCQYCKMIKRETQTAIIENPQLIRNIEEILELFSPDQTRYFREPKDAFGIKRYSYLFQIENFDVCKNMIFDIMHDLFEGCIPLTLIQFIETAIRLKIITLDNINDRILNFDYGIHLNNSKPREVKLDQPSMGISASQKWILFEHFPFIFPELVSNEHLASRWKTLGFLLGITKICLKSTIYERDLNQLETYIGNYLESYLRMYRKTLIPKQHFLTHYPRIIRNMGPPTTMWTMRFEINLLKKHKIKKVLIEINNFGV